MPRRRFYAGADQPARLSLEINSIEHDGERIPVVSEDILQMPFCALTRLARVDGTQLPKIFVVAPLSGHFPLLLRDLVVGLLPTFQVFIIDWVNARHVALERGPFDLERCAGRGRVLSRGRSWPRDRAPPGRKPRVSAHSGYGRSAEQ